MNALRMANPSSPRYYAAHLAIVGWGLLLGLLYAAALLAFPLLEWYSQRHTNLGKLAAAGRLDWGLLALGAGMALVAYGMGYRALARLPNNGLGLGLVLGFPILFSLLLVWVQPITSVDLYDYLFRGRLLAHYGANPFTTIPDAFKSDQFYYLIGWQRTVTAYGPLWELLAWPIAHAADNQLLLLLLGYKLLALISLVLGTGAIWWLRVGRSRAQRLRGVYLWLWNPLLLWELLASGHNDGWLALALIIGALALQGRRYRLAMVALIAGALVKFLPLLFAPIVLIRAAQRDGLRGVGRVAQGTVLGGIVILLAYWPFWAGKPTFTNLLERQPLWYGAPLSLVRLESAHLLGVVVGPWDSWPGAGLTLGALGLAAIIGLVTALRSNLRDPELFALMTGVILYVANPWYQPWYFIWLLGLVACSISWGALVRMIFIFTWTALYSYWLDSWLLGVLGWAADGQAWQLLTVLCIYLPPLLAFIPFPALFDQTRSAARRLALGFPFELRIKSPRID